MTRTTSVMQRTDRMISDYYIPEIELLAQITHYILLQKLKNLGCRPTADVWTVAKGTPKWQLIMLNLSSREILNHHIIPASFALADSVAKPEWSESRHRIYATRGRVTFYTNIDEYEQFRGQISNENKATCSGEGLSVRVRKFHIVFEDNTYADRLAIEILTKKE